MHLYESACVCVIESLKEEGGRESCIYVFVLVLGGWYKATLYKERGRERNCVDLSSVPWSLPSVPHTAAFVPVIRCAAIMFVPRPSHFTFLFAT